MIRVATFDFGGQFAPQAYQNLLNKIDALPSHDHSILILGCREEDCSPAEHHARTLQLQQHIHRRGMQFCVLLNWFTQFTAQTMPGVDVNYVDFMLLKTVYHNPGHTNSQRRPGILFLMGKPDRDHRAPLLYKFYENRTLDQLTWSLALPLILQPAVRDLIPQANDQQWQQFLSLQHSPDNATVMEMNDSIHIANPFKTNPGLYQQTHVSLISESLWINTDPSEVRLTEKTYKAIDNKHAFVIAGPPGTLERLKSLGYRTFENYLPHATYDLEVDHKTRLQMVYENVLCLNQLVGSKAIAEDINHNYTVNRQRYRAELDRVSTALAKYGYHGSPIDVLMLHDHLVSNTLTDRHMQFDHLPIG